MSSRESARRFQFLREIASGGFGSVYLAKVMHPDGFSRLAAVKLLHRRWTENEEVTRRMRDEARLLGWLRHRNIVDVVDLTSIDGRAAIVMEYLEAVDLKVIIRAATVSGDYVPAGAALQIAAYCASALDAAYNRPPYAGEKPLRVIHRDIKPSNIMVDESGMVKVLDFGVARAEFDARESETRELQFGSVDYMPPERLFFEPDTPAADVYSLASTLYEVLVLEKLGKAKMSLAKHSAFVEERLAYMRSCLGISAQEAGLLEDLLRSCLAFEPEHRPSSAEMVTHCRSLGRMLQGPSLAEWAELAVPPLIAAAREAPRKPNPLTDSVLTEDSLAFGRGEAEAASPAEPVRASPPPGWNQPSGGGLSPIAAPVSEPEDVPTVRLSSEAIAEQIAKATSAAPAQPSTLKPIERSGKAEGPALDLGPSDPWAVGGPRLVSVPLGPADGDDEWADLPTRVDQPPVAPLDAPPGGDQRPAADTAQALKDAETVLLPDAINIDALDELADDPMPPDMGAGPLGGAPPEAGAPALFGDMGPEDAPFSAGPLAEPPPGPAEPGPPASAYAGGGDDTAIFGPGEDIVEPEPERFGAPEPERFGAPEPERFGAPEPERFGAPEPLPPPDLSRSEAGPAVFDPGPAPPPPSVRSPAVSEPSGPPPAQGPAVFDPPPPPVAQGPMVFDPPPPPPSSPEPEGRSGGGVVRALSAVAALILLGALGGGGFFVYKTFIASGDGPAASAGGSTPASGGAEGGGAPSGGAGAGGPEAGGAGAGGAEGGGAEAGGAEAGGAEAGGAEAGGAGAGGAASPASITFISQAPSTKKLQINCTDGSARGGSEAVIESAGGRCRVTAIMEDRSRLTVVVDDASAGTYRCFADGEERCTR